MDRPKIPTAMKRNIRRRCGFGCVICGMPIYVYHHIEGFSPDVGHIEREITLLCEECHRKHHNRLITKRMVEEHDDNPCNIAAGQSTPTRVWYAKDHIEVRLGSVSMHNFPRPPLSFTPLILDGRSMLRLDLDESNVWILSLRIVDPWHRELITINENELTYAITDTDVNYSGGRLTIKGGKDVYFSAKFEPPVLSIEKAIFNWNGIYAAIDELGVHVLNSGLSIQGIQLMYSN